MFRHLQKHPQQLNIQEDYFTQVVSGNSAIRAGGRSVLTTHPFFTLLVRKPAALNMPTTQNLRNQLPVRHQSASRLTEGLRRQHHSVNKVV